MPAHCLEKHQLAGLDDRTRGFNRIIEVRQDEKGCCAILHYEAGVVAGANTESEQAALRALIEQLHAAGFTQLRSQLSFRGAAYFGSKEPWIEYPDPERPDPFSSGLLARIFGLFGRR